MFCLIFTFIYKRIFQRYNYIYKTQGGEVMQITDVRVKILNIDNIPLNVLIKNLSDGQKQKLKFLF